MVDVDPGSAGYGSVTTILDQAALRDVALNPDERLAIVTDVDIGVLAVDIDPASPTYGTVTRLLTRLCGPHDVRLNAAESVACVVEVDGRRLIAID